jgi:hypothetical protein
VGKKGLVVKTCLFTLSYLDGVDNLGNNRLERNLKYLNYYWPLRKEFGFQKIVMADNCSSVKSLAYLSDLAPASLGIQSEAQSSQLIPDFEIQLFRFEDHLAYGTTFPQDDPRSYYDYPYCWRGFDFLRRVFGHLNYDRVILIDSDGFVLSPRLAHFMRDIASGWTSFWCKKYGFPEASLQVIDRNSFRSRYFTEPWQSHVGEIMEWSLPFTEVNRGFNCDRYGETRTPVSPDMDYYGQALNEMAMVYRGSP